MHAWGESGVLKVRPLWDEGERQIEVESSGKVRAGRYYRYCRYY